jgi:DNA repair exonuclease SbcCD ATPase subunit
MKIISLEAENFKRIRAVSIKPDGSAVIIGGKNMAGKSSALDAIRAALGGKKQCPEEPIRRGAKKAEIVLDTESLTVRRTFSKKGTAIEVTAKDGSRYSSPQKMLDELIGGLSFDPLAFSRMRPDEQAEIVRRLAGLDFAAQDEQRAKLYGERTEIGRDLKRERANYESIPEVKDPPESEVAIAEAVRELNRRRELNQQNEQKRENLQSKRGKIEILGLTIEDTEKEHAAEITQKRADLAALIKQAEAEIDEFRKNSNAEIGRLESELKTESQAFAKLEPEISALKDEDLAKIQDVIDNAEETNKRYRQARDRKAAKARTEEIDAEYRRLSREIDDIDEAKAATIQDAKYPIDGLQVTDEGIELNGLPFEQASSAEQLQCSVAMGLALNPELRVLLIKDGSFLDDDNLALVAKMAAQAEAQVWIERVGTGDECTVVIEDGETVSQTK